MAPTYHEVAPKIDLDDEAPKPTKKKTKTVSRTLLIPYQCSFSNALRLDRLSRHTHHTYISCDC